MTPPPATRQLYRPLFWLVIALAALLLIEPHLRRAADHNRHQSGANDTSQPLWVQYVMIGLGGFRGLISETLWLRAAHLQEQGRYFEQMQLAEWITALDPRATDAWVYNSWNLAYNISAMMPRHTDRLTWVNAGISLLRDRALPANPDSPRLYRELGWLYQNKIGDFSDSANLYYKVALAESATPCLLPDGRLPPPESERFQSFIALFHFVPDTLARLEENLGYRFDWRLPQSHAIYWAWSGLPHASGFEHQALRRMIHQNLMELLRKGSFNGMLTPAEYQTLPALELFPVTCNFFETSIALYPGETSIYARFLAVAISHQMQAGDPAAARATYQRLQALADKHRRTIPGFEQLASGTFPDEPFFAPRE